MNTIDSYFEYSVPITKNMNVGNHPLISDVRNDVKVDLPNGNTITTRWIQFKIPVSSQFYRSNKYSSFFKSINGIDNLRSIRFMRMYLKKKFKVLDQSNGKWDFHKEGFKKNRTGNNS